MFKLQNVNLEKYGWRLQTGWFPKTTGEVIRIFSRRDMTVVEEMTNTPGETIQWVVDWEELRDHLKGLEDKDLKKMYEESGFPGDTNQSWEEASKNWGVVTCVANPIWDIRTRA